MADPGQRDGGGGGSHRRDRNHGSRRGGHHPSTPPPPQNQQESRSLRQRNRLYLSHLQLQSILQNPYYSSPYTVSHHEYTFYRGEIKTHVLTLRFNRLPTFTPTLLHQVLLEHLFETFPRYATLIVTLDADVLLRGGDTPPWSYYIWRANSNRRHFEHRWEWIMVNANENIHQLVQDLVRFSPLDHFQPLFKNSTVSAVTTLSLVCSFMQVN